MSRAASNPPPSWETVVPALLGWFPQAARDLPWRRTTDPYALWISEVMLQQTQVRTVIGYWERWMTALPDVAALAGAPAEQILKLWEGLGYYTRARNLQKAALQLMAANQGRFPDTLPGILELPGIGPYTAGAIASFAFNLPAPILDGNVIRVLTRLAARPGDPREKATNEALWGIATDLVEIAARLSPEEVPSPLPPMCLAGACSQLNQALMELGATVCTPTAPACERCPIASQCQARALGRQEDFPETTARPPVTQRSLATVIWSHQRRWLVRLRPAEGVNAGFWEFPNLEFGPEAEPRSALARWLGVNAGALQPLGTVKHSITRYRFTQHLFRLTIPPAGNLPAGELRWATPAELTALALTASHRRLVKQWVKP